MPRRCGLTVLIGQVARFTRRLPSPGLRGIIALLTVMGTVLVAVVALANLPPSSSTSKRESTTQAAVTAGSVEQALLRQKPPPRLEAASCRAPTTIERTRATIGGADSRFFSCMITVEGQAARFYVQVLSNGSLIAEDERRTQEQIFGCCVARPSR